MCKACNTDYHTLDRVWWHLTHSKPSCLHWIVNNQQPLTQEQVQEAQDRHKLAEQVRRDKGLPTRYAWPPPERLPGPQRPLVNRSEATQFFQFDIPSIQPEHLPSTPQYIRESTRSIPRPFRWYYVLHLFSGQRRMSDFQYFADLLVSKHQLPVVVLSIDIVNDAIYGDLSNPDTIQYWRQSIIEGQTLAILGGPPCETWSAARFLEIVKEALAKQPRPIRSSQELWGLPDLTPSEQTSIQLGNALLRALITLLHTAWLYNASGLMEHPAWPSWIPAHKLPPSSELLPELVDLAQKPGVSLFKFDQCMAGASYKKPTAFHLVHLPEIAAAFLSQPNGCKCIRGNRAFSTLERRAHTHDTLSGLDDLGNFRTTPSKQYPPLMCELMAKGVIDNISRRISARHEVDWNDFSAQKAYAFFMPLDLYLPEHAWGMYGSDNAAARSRANDSSRVSFPPEANHSSGFEAAQLHQTSDSLALAYPVPTLSPELAERIAANRAEAARRRQARRVELVRSLPVTVLPPEVDSQPVSRYTVGQIGATHVSTGSSIRNRFHMGNTTADQAKKATAFAAANSSSATLATVATDLHSH